MGLGGGGRILPYILYWVRVGPKGIVSDPFRSDTVWVSNRVRCKLSWQFGLGLKKVWKIIHYFGVK